MISLLCSSFKNYVTFYNLKDGILEKSKSYCLTGKSYAKLLIKLLSHSWGAHNKTGLLCILQLLQLLFCVFAKIQAKTMVLIVSSVEITLIFLTYINLGP